MRSHQGIHSKVSLTKELLLRLWRNCWADDLGEGQGPAGGVIGTFLTVWMFNQLQRLLAFKNEP